MRVFLALAIGYLGHRTRPYLADHVPYWHGWFPIACYVLGGILVLACDAMINGVEHAKKTAVPFVLVGTGVVSGWITER